MHIFPRYLFGMTLAQWMTRTGATDKSVAESINRDRGHISKLRRGAAKPSLDMMLAVRELTNGKVALEDWAPARRRVRA